eukprot:CAMPEP_0197554998 /NCGR_PEP_ID=MMETSP1320-20131121/12474_1 /TAXON_ID=91990 /ORGANISM="Bolidomonas sp., Strain RCC2347" /LENGTH=201 /DNA_ID=CAMNT_0043115957 /DNA_START=30 /DNA_END=632 /DNA_ORIENTATION=+
MKFGRSAEALARRAKKRGRMLAEQREADRLDTLSRINSSKKSKTEDKRQPGSCTLVSPLSTKGREAARSGPPPPRRPQDSTKSSNLLPVPKPPATKWKCSKCGNENWLRREVCNSKTCQERRPPSLASAAAAVQRSAKEPRPSAKPAAASSWAPQAPPEKIKENEELLRRLEAGEELDEESRSRAEVLKKRRERKLQKKAE